MVTEWLTLPAHLPYGIFSSQSGLHQRYRKILVLATELRSEFWYTDSIQNSNRSYLSKYTKYRRGILLFPMSDWMTDWWLYPCTYRPSTAPSAPNLLLPFLSFLSRDTISLAWMKTPSYLTLTIFLEKAWLEEWDEARKPVLNSNRYFSYHQSS